MKQKHIPSAAALLALLVGVLCPLCLLAPILLTAGLGSILALAAPWFAPLLLILLGISLIGFFLSYLTHKNPFPLILTIVAGGLMYYSRYISYNNALAYLGGALLLGTIGLDWWIRKNNKECVECKVNYSHQKKH
jgi:putative Mn2+ efflux pump MntP